MAMMQPDQSVDRMLDILDRMNKRSQIDNDLLPQLQPRKPVTSFPPPPPAPHPPSVETYLPLNIGTAVDPPHSSALMLVSKAPSPDEVLPAEEVTTPTKMQSPETAVSGNLFFSETPLDTEQYVASPKPLSPQVLSNQVPASEDVCTTTFIVN